MKIVTLPNGQQVSFRHRNDMPKAKRNRAELPQAVPATTLPVDCTGGATVSCPIDGNDSLGDCGPCMAAHVNGIRTFGQGKPGFGPELQAPVATLESQYETVSGGDNGTTEDMLVGDSGGPDGSSGPGIWLVGIAGDATACVVDHLDIDPSNVPLVQYCHDQFYHVCMAWSVPDAFLNAWTSGSSWLSPMTPDSENGHFIPLSDVDANGNYRLWTWGGWCWVSQSFVMSVEPACFVTFSALQFRAIDGYDSHGRHVSDVGAAWVSIGGSASIVASVVSKFPPKSAPPTPASVPPTTLGSGSPATPLGPASTSGATS
jgi:hypothetical protein